MSSQWPLPAPGGSGARLRQLPFGPEHARRLDIFAQNLAKAQRLQEEDLGTAEFGVTPFSDLTGTGTAPPPQVGKQNLLQGSWQMDGQIFGFCFPEGLTGPEPWVLTPNPRDQGQELQRPVAQPS